MNLKIEHKLAVVTGASGGLGMAIAQSLAQEGADVIWVARNTDKLAKLTEQASAQYNNNNRYFSVDLKAIDGPKILLDWLSSKNLQPDIVINNVGGNLGVTDPLSPVEAWRDVMQFNLLNAIEINNALLPSMRAKKWGRICHISSIASLENQGTPMYCAAKAALNAYVRSVGRYVSKDNVVMTAVLPGAVFTEGGYWDETLKSRPEHVEKYLSERMAIKRFGTPEEISEFVAFLVSDKASFAIGTSVLLDGGQGRVFFEG
ncbi:SDR family oxidoreductase [Aliiglaciecola sp. LCG003]|uniref:SDR family NAD(P)-dependent oxidoreductase n=1 Tax=Aliiglaciecola sp. LCG003 TaxID=3053655 RepID=UPI00257359F7|nr:SDR family oxidoreductase [Aliiglaciecola sp. LCG003]WJG10591.1 SDR family oxidoreductase [Aliiglaciecola sp. LCG003]